MPLRRRAFWIALGAGLALECMAPAAAEIKIGFAHPLSGPYQATGHRNGVGVETAVETINRNGGVLGEPVELVVADDACGIEQAAVAARQLIAAGVQAVIGHMCSHSSLIAAGYYEAADVLMITPGSTHPRLTEEGRRNVFRLIGRDDRQGQLAADFLAANWADKRIAILHDGSTYGEGLAREVRQYLHHVGVVETLYERYEPGAADYEALARQLREAEVDVLYVGGYGPDAARIIKAARAAGDDVQLVGGDGLNMDEFKSVAGPQGEGAIFTGRPDVRDEPGAATVLATFRERGLGVRTGGVAAYAAVQAWAQAVERAGTDKLFAVADVLRRGRFGTALGRIGFDDKGDLRDAAWQWQVWIDGTYVPLSEAASIN